MRNRPFIANLDMYRKVPVDLLEGTRRGSILSTIAVATAVTAVTPTSTFTTVPAAVPAGASASSASRTPGAAELSAPV